MTDSARRIYSCCQAKRIGPIRLCLCALVESFIFWNFAFINTIVAFPRLVFMPDKAKKQRWRLLLDDKQSGNPLFVLPLPAKSCWLCNLTQNDQIAKYQVACNIAILVVWSVDINLAFLLGYFIAN